MSHLAPPSSQQIRRLLVLLSGLLLYAVLLAACAQPAAAPPATHAPAASEPQVTTIVETVEVSVEGETIIVTATPEPAPTAAQAGSTQPAAKTQPAAETQPAEQATEAAAATEAPVLQPTALSPTSQPSPTAVIEPRLVELEWPPTIRMGQSDVIRMALIPDSDGYTIEAELPDHQVLTQTVEVKRPQGYELYAIGRLDAVGFEISPSDEQKHWLPEGEAVTWRWSITPRRSGSQPVSVSLLLRWEAPDALAARQTVVYSRTLPVQVVSFLGLSQPVALGGGVAGLLLGSVLTFLAFSAGRRATHPATIPVPAPEPAAVLLPNPDLQIDLPAGLALPDEQRALLQAVFGRYARLIVLEEFLSGYSGARAFLAQPVRPDGRTDAFTIVKTGPQADIQREFENYETYVKDTLPPVTARLQGQGVVTVAPSTAGHPAQPVAALRYTFIGEAGSRPVSLRQALLAQGDQSPDPAWLQRLFDTFGPQWWMQRRPYTFRLAQEYDRMLPVHLVLAPAPLREGVTVAMVDGRQMPGALNVTAGQRVQIAHFERAEPRLSHPVKGSGGGPEFTLYGTPSAGHPPLRVRWLGEAPPTAGAYAQVKATRISLLQSWTAAFDRQGLPDPLPHLPRLLEETVRGGQSTIHGDLNLENALVGPGGLVWLIDFAQTRDGHCLYDFAHLQAEIIAHIIAPHSPSPAAYLDLLRGQPAPDLAPFAALLETLDRLAQRCLFDPQSHREWELAQILGCLGALKFANLPPQAKELLYLTAAFKNSR